MVRRFVVWVTAMGSAACAVVAGLSTDYSTVRAPDAPPDAAEPPPPSEDAVTPDAGGMLVGDVVDISDEPDAGYDLTAEGTVDWIHWGAGYDGGQGVYPGVDRKSTGRVISDVVALIDPGDADPTSLVGAWQYAPPSARLASWSDGTPTPAAANAGGYIWVDDVVGSGFVFTAPADTSPRTLSIYCGGWQTTGTLSAQLSDGSAPDLALVAPRQDAGGYTSLFTLRYRAASPGAKLTVRYLTSDCPSNGCGSVDLMAAWLR